ncbi:MAG TPA: fumarylacetoacetate hydrolase family protein [Terriglobales bacterium]|nr:fumarylacetoacetate hydrolase family protein [Terriglobales bacterium]
MKLLNFVSDGEVKLGVLTENGVAVMTGAKGFPQTMQEAIELGIPALKALDLSSLPTVCPDCITYAPVVTAPEKIICVGLNYLEHVKESYAEVPKWPCLFSKFNTALAAHGETIELPAVDEKYDYEAELVIVIGKGGRDIAKKDAKDHVFGYTCGNDLSARTLQMRTGQWLTGKTIDKFGPVGPVIATADVTDGDNLPIKLIRGGVVCQDSNTNDLVFDVSTIVSYCSLFVNLKPGDIIFTGTPQGVIGGKSEGEKNWLKPGEVLTVAIEGIGELTNTLA